MRTISDIKQDISDHEAKIAMLNDELRTFVDHCPHPVHFVERDVKHYYDECGAPVYEGSLVTYECSLCEGKFHATYDKRANPNSFSDTPPPTLEEILSKDK